MRTSTKQTTRLLRVECAHGGYLVRVTRKWLTAYGPPICPCHGEVMRESTASPQDATSGGTGSVAAR